MRLSEIRTLDLFGTMATLEAAHEPDMQEAAENNLKTWGITAEEGYQELERRRAK